MLIKCTKCGKAYDETVPPTVSIPWICQECINKIKKENNTKLVCDYCGKLSDESFLMDGPGYWTCDKCFDKFKALDCCFKCNKELNEDEFVNATTSFPVKYFCNKCAKKFAIGVTQSVDDKKFQV
jgi:hypothetical protein